MEQIIKSIPLEMRHCDILLYFQFVYYLEQGARADLLLDSYFHFSYKFLYKSKDSTSITTGNKLNMTKELNT